MVYGWITITYRQAFVLETFSVFQTTLCDFPYPTSGMNCCLENKISYPRPWFQNAQNLTVLYLNISKFISLYINIQLM